MTLGPATSTHGPAEMARVSGPIGGPVGGPVSREEPAVMVTRTCPDCATEVGSDDLICFTCGANLPRVLSADEPPPPITVAQKALSGNKAGRRISSAVLRITFPAGNVEVPAGTSVMLGRDPAESLVAAGTRTPQTGHSSTTTGCCRVSTSGSLTVTPSGWPRMSPGGCQFSSRLAGRAGRQLLLRCSSLVESFVRLPGAWARAGEQLREELGAYRALFSTRST